MSHAKIAVAAGTVLSYANDSGAPDALVERRALHPDAVVTPRRDPTTEVLIFVERGRLEVMIDGATAYVETGGHVRVGAGRVCAYRNAGDSVASVLTVRLDREDRRNFAARLIATVAA